MCISLRLGTATDMLRMIVLLASSIAPPKPNPCLFSPINATDKTKPTANKKTQTQPQQMNQTRPQKSKPHQMDNQPSLPHKG